jgi:hypothetical protein
MRKGGELLPGDTKKKDEKLHRLSETRMDAETAMQE